MTPQDNVETPDVIILDENRITRGVYYKETVENLLSQERAKVVWIVEKLVMSANEGTPEQLNNVKTYNTALYDVIFLLNNLKRDEVEPKESMNIQPSRDERLETTINFNPLAKE